MGMVYDRWYRVWVWCMIGGIGYGVWYVWGA